MRFKGIRWVFVPHPLTAWAIVAYTCAASNRGFIFTVKDARQPSASGRRAEANGVLTLIMNAFAKPTGRIHHGVSPQVNTSQAKEIVFAGRTRIESKRKMIRFWSEHQSRLGMDLHEFTRCCALMEDERTIVFHPVVTIAKLV